MKRRNGHVHVHGKVGLKSETTNIAWPAALVSRDVFRDHWDDTIGFVEVPHYGDTAWYKVQDSFYLGCSVSDHEA